MLSRRGGGLTDYVKWDSLSGLVASEGESVNILEEELRRVVREVIREKFRRKIRRLSGS